MTQLFFPSPTHSRTSASFLHTKVDIVNPQRRKVFIRPLDIEQQPPKRHIHLSAAPRTTSASPFLSPKTQTAKRGHSHILIVPLLEAIDFPMADVIVLVRHAGLAPADIPPPLAVVLAAVERERRREQDLQPVADGAGEELRVDVEGEGGVAVFGVGGEAGDAVVFLRVDGGEGEGVGEEVGVAHGLGGWVGGGVGWDGGGVQLGGEGGDSQTWKSFGRSKESLGAAGTVFCLASNGAPSLLVQICNRTFSVSPFDHNN